MQDKWLVGNSMAYYVVNVKSGQPEAALRLPVGANFNQENAACRQFALAVVFCAIFTVREPMILH